MCRLSNWSDHLHCAFTLCRSRTWVDYLHSAESIYIVHLHCAESVCIVRLHCAESICIVRLHCAESICIVHLTCAESIYIVHLHCAESICILHLHCAESIYIVQSPFALCVYIVQSPFALCIYIVQSPFALCVYIVKRPFALCIYIVQIKLSSGPITLCRIHLHCAFTLCRSRTWVDHLHFFHHVDTMVDTMWIQYLDPVRESSMCMVGQNHTFIGIYDVHTVFLAGKSPYIRSYTEQIYGSGQPYVCGYHVDTMVYTTCIPRGSSMWIQYVDTMWILEWEECLRWLASPTAAQNTIII